jgi:hypothetical protein
MTSLLLALSALTITIITSPYLQPAGPFIMPLGASAAVVNASIMPEKSMCGFFFTTAALELARGGVGLWERSELLTFVGHRKARNGVSKLCGFAFENGVEWAYFTKCSHQLVLVAKYIYPVPDSI